MKRLFTAADRENSMTIEVRNVCKSFKDVDAVLNVNLRVESGEAVALLGPNGAGQDNFGGDDRRRSKLQIPAKY